MGRVSRMSWLDALKRSPLARSRLMIARQKYSLAVAPAHSSISAARCSVVNASYASSRIWSFVLFSSCRTGAAIPVASSTMASAFSSIFMKRLTNALSAFSLSNLSTEDDPSTDHRKRDKSSSRRDKDHRRSRRADRDMSSKTSERRKSGERTEDRERTGSTDSKAIPTPKPTCTRVHLKSEPVIDSDVKVIPMPPKRGRRRW
mmetsp:Transcript_103717/g.298234  ORF Transcript_103717/g.298234 Transcript_103717/m.298234 type:complete len:203 (-) Transcript_103717:869-1477(-)